MNKLQVTKITNGLNSIKGGGNGQTDTLADKTEKTYGDTILTPTLQ